MKAPKKVNAVERIKGFLLKVGLLILTLAMNNDVALRFLGWTNAALFKGRFRTATLFYLADRRYVESVTFKWYAKKRKWTPVLAGFFSYSGVAGFILAVGCSEDEIRKQDNASRILEIYRRVEHIAKLLKVSSASYAGIFPSLLVKLGISREPIEAIRTVQWVGKALELVQVQCKMPCSTSVVVLGSDGHIGRRLINVLRDREQVTVTELDSRTMSVEQARSTLSRLKRPYILINVAKHEALDEYIDLIPPGSVVLNEVYPECDEKTLSILKANKVRYFHICGVLADSAMPRFPRAYAGAIPCCAASAVATISENKHLPENVVLREP